jgi:CobQ-like glutamine amidotransferase family enzyme
VEQGVPLLSICGGYQLLGDYYEPFAAQVGSFSTKSRPLRGPKLPGIGLFPAFTQASHDRMIGNIIIKPSDELVSQLVGKSEKPLLVGFENHSGKTHLKDGGKPLGKVVKGFGNNGKDHTEGCIYKNAIGCYMHGSLLPKNPALADWLLSKALEVKYGEEIELKSLDDELEQKAHQAAIQRFS